VERPVAASPDAAATGGISVPRVQFFALALSGAVGGLVFGGDSNGRFKALDDKTGAVLWETIVGSPASKMDNLDRLITRHRIRPERALMIGDSQHDYAAARAFGIPFLLVTGYAAEDPRPLAELVRRNGGTVVQALDELNLNEVQ